MAAKCNAPTWSACTTRSDLATCWQSGASTGGGVDEVTDRAESRADRIQRVTESIDPTTPGKLVSAYLWATTTRNLSETSSANGRTRGWQPREHAVGKAAGEKSLVRSSVAVSLYRQKKHTIDEICKAVSINADALLRRGGWRHMTSDRGHAARKILGPPKV